MNLVQLRALQEIILDDSYDEHQREKERFRQMLVASNLSQAKALLKSFAEEDDETLAPKIDWEQHDFRPDVHSAEELEDVMADIRGLGFSLEEMGSG